eukprot:g143.t1
MNFMFDVPKFDSRREMASNAFDFMEEENFLFEETISKNPYSVKCWWSYIQSKREESFYSPSSSSSSSKAKLRSLTMVRNAIHERALRQLPGSYKLWQSYLSDRRKQTRGKRPGHAKFKAANNAFERALVTMHKYPRVWTDFCEFLMEQKFVTRTRRTFDRALQALPVTQHKRIWKLYIDWVKGIGVWQTAVRVYRRYLRFDASHREDYVDFLLTNGQFNKAAEELSTIIMDETFISVKQKSQHDLWMDLCSIISAHPKEIVSVDVDAILRSGIKRFSDELGQLWCSLAEYYIRLGLFGKARDVYEEAMGKVMTVRDFSLVFDACSQFEEQMIRAKMELLSAEDKDEEVGEDGDDIDLRLAKLEALMDRRPLLLSDVHLRQNPHNVSAWESRVKLFSAPVDIISCYSKAVETVIPLKATGKPHNLWIAFGRYYANRGDLKNADIVFERASSVKFKYLDHLALVWCSWIEVHLNAESFEKAIGLVHRATATPPKYIRNSNKENDYGNGFHNQLYKSSRLWRLRIDLEENLGSVESTRKAYDQMITLKIASVRTILNYATFLKENKFFEDSFRIYETGISLFHWPHVKEVWSSYLTDFTNRFKGTKLERARELFEEVISQAPSKHVLNFFISYAAFEDEHGMVRHALSILDRAIQVVPTNSKMKIFVIYLRKVEEYFGIAKTREIYERAIDENTELPDMHIRDMCLRFAQVEKKLGEIDRSRAIFKHGAQYADPLRVPTYWKSWHDFEVSHGNEDTFRDMLRTKRFIAAQISSAVSASENINGDSGPEKDEKMRTGTKRSHGEFENNSTNQNLAMENNSTNQPFEGALERFQKRQKI